MHVRSTYYFGLGLLYKPFDHCIHTVPISSDAILDLPGKVLGLWESLYYIIQMHCYRMGLFHYLSLQGLSILLVGVHGL